MIPVESVGAQQSVNGGQFHVEMQSDALFVGDEWNNCSSENGGAIYAHDNTAATLNVSNCTFTNCKATTGYGGGIYALKIARVATTHSSFTGCEWISGGDSGGGGVCTHNVTAHHEISNSVFNCCVDLGEESRSNRNIKGTNCCQRNQTFQ
jgi:hypothetical protein